jgi:hypothetical protein
MFLTFNGLEVSLILYSFLLTNDLFAASKIFGLPIQSFLTVSLLQLDAPTDV